MGFDLVGGVGSLKFNDSSLNFHLILFAIGRVGGTFALVGLLVLIWLLWCVVI